jgi:MtfA peptidase
VACIALCANDVGSMFGFFRNRRRRKVLAQPFPQAWLDILQRNVRMYTSLTSDEQKKLRDDLRVFIADRWWEGCNGLTLDDTMRVTIAAQACVLTLHLPEDVDWFRAVRTVLVHPESFLSASKRHGPGGVVSEGFANSGEAWHNGPVVLSWADALWGGRNAMDGRNLVLHEFAHVLDMADGVSNGTPPLKSREEYRRWHEVMTGEYQRLINDAEFGHATLLDVYGATNVAEFFAVATEAFFERGRAMRQIHPELYNVLAGLYRHDPAEWK